MEGKVLQINLHHSRTASLELLLVLEEGGYDVALIQEPWISSGNKVSGLESNNFQLFYSPTVRKTRSAILVRKNTNSYFIPRFSTDDLTVIALEGDEGQKIFASCYMAHNVEAPPMELQHLMREAHQRGLEVVVGADANSHHPQWGSKDINERSECLLNYILENNKSLANRGNIPTFKGPTSEEVLDITLFYGNNLQIFNWKVLEQPSYSDHRYISFTFSGKIPKAKATFRNPRKTNWDLYEILLKDYTLSSPQILSSRDIEAAIDSLTSKILLAYQKSCPLTRLRGKSKPPWWNKDIGKQRRELREFLKLAKLADCAECWREYNALRSLYKKEIRKAKRSSWRDFCGNLDRISEASRLRKILAKSPIIPTLIRKDTASGPRTERKRLRFLLKPTFLDVRGSQTPHLPRKQTGTTKFVRASLQHLDWNGP